MSTRNTIIILCVAGVLAILILSRFGVRAPFRGYSPTDSALLVPQKPATRPERPDLELFSQFQGQPMVSILNVLTAKGEPVSEENSAASILAGSLPNAPFPFPEGVKPVNEISLKQYLENVDSGKLGNLTLVDRWRYNLVSAALGISTDSLPKNLQMNVLPQNETENFPVHFVPRNSALLEGPVVVGNFDSDPAMEIISHGGTRLWKLDENGEPKDPPIIIEEGPGGIIRAVDFDQDGDLDLFIARRHGLPNSLLQNDGNGNFTNVTSEVGLLAFSDTTAAEWVDFDNDGLIDLVVGNDDHPLEVYRQESPGVFKAVSWDMDLWIPGNVTDIVVADFNRDRFPDFYVAIRDLPDQLLYSIPSTLISSWRFVDNGKKYQVVSDASQVVAPIDFDNDGDLDLLVGEKSEDSEQLLSATLNSGPRTKGKSIGRLKLFENVGEGVLRDITSMSGLDKVVDVRKIHVLDIDRDGFDDILIISGDLAFNQAYWNRGGTLFRDISEASRFNYLDSPIDIQSADVDGDGSEDLFLTNKNGSLTWLETEGAIFGWLGLSLDRAIPGTQVVVLSRDTDWILQSIPRVLSEGIPQMRIGLGPVKKLEKIEIYLPQFKEPVKILENIQPNQYLKIDSTEKK